MDHSALVLHPRVVASAYQGNFCVLHLLRAVQFPFSAEQGRWFEALKTGKGRAQILASLPGENSERFVAELLENEILVAAPDGAGEMPAWVGALPELSALAKAFPISQPQEGQWGFAFADATISSSLGC